MKMAGDKRIGDNDTSKDEVVIQMVNREVDGRSSYPALTKTNYSSWVLLMKVKLKTRAFWSVFEDDDANQQEEMMVIDALCGTVPLEMVPMIAKKDTSKEAWDKIATMSKDSPQQIRSTT
jgi:hypothetical protein